jgi:5'-AMP-activated protein kinase regulatory gamma subunit
MRRFLKGRVSYDVLPLSFRLIMMDTSLTVKNSLAILMQNGTSRVWSEGRLTAQGIVSAPLWDSKTSTFAGLITAHDYINVIQYYWQNQDKLAEIDKFRLRNLPGELAKFSNSKLTAHRYREGHRRRAR